MCLHAQYRNRSGVRILDWDVSWRGKRGGGKREKRQDCAASLEAPSSAASQSCRGPGILSSQREKLWRGRPAELSPRGPPQPFPAPAIPCPSPQDTFECPFCSCCHQTLEQGPSGTLSSAASASLVSLSRSWHGKSQEMQTAVGSEGPSRGDIPGRVPVFLPTQTQVPLVQYLPWPS